ncbi:MFS transporter [Herbidospora sp. NBRC 101105]|uniref:MFS transporter n=1 Tax=Herbidospora sp. NBRC 101105 TaxID=3032195 RepID=UPI0024A0883F|nr:MFS transporter [Herbidospora sp. NBRC 101105]GLX99585.1 MFS transporter [Herbidospora sp. NBRC 101105]
MTDAPRLGLRANLPQFTLLVVVNAMVGGMLGQERTVVPLLAEQVFALSAHTALLTYILAFGLSKAVTNLFSGSLCDRFGRRPVLVAGWLVGLPVPLLIIWAPGWEWVIAANVLLGINQGLTWSATVIMKIDLVGPERRGLAMGFNESAGYLAVAVTALVTGYLAELYGLRPAPFLLGLAYAVIGLGLSAVWVRETRGFVSLEARGTDRRSLREIFVTTSFRDPSLSSVSQAGLVNNLNDGVAWGLFPVLFMVEGLTIAEIGVLTATLPAVWGLGQIAAGALSDRWGRKRLIAGGMLLQGAALAWIAAADDFAPWAVAAALVGAGTAMVYPTLLAAVADVAHPSWRARAVGVYRWWRDFGFAVGAVAAGLLADSFGVRVAVVVTAAVTVMSGLVVAVRMRETRPGPGAVKASL